MRSVAELPRIHFFVCANQRDLDSSLGPGCGDAGEALYQALKDEVAARRAYRTVWITRTHCLGVCPRQGATLAIYPQQAVLTEVTAGDAPRLFQKIVGSGP
jgi:(2Fe-2S) ferredoxin